MGETMTAGSAPAPLEALHRLNEMFFGFMTTQTLAAACSLGIFDFLEQECATAEKVSEKAGIHAEGGRRLLAALQVLGLVEATEGQYRNSPLGSMLSTKAPMSLEGLSMWGAPFPHMWEYLPDALRELSPRWRQALNTSAEETFAALYEDTARLRRFMQKMDAYSIPEGEEVARRVDFAPHRCIMDVGGGPGGFIIAIGKRHPHLRGIVMDLPPVCKIAEEQIRLAGLEGRFRAATADLLTGPYPQGADVITLGWILHDWGDENCHKILRNCHAALPPGGTLLINEAVLKEDHTGTLFGVLMSLHMAVVCEPGARERTESEYRGLLEASGFSLERVLRYGGLRDLLVARKG